MSRQAFLAFVNCGAMVARVKAPFRKMQAVLAHAVAHLGEDVSLTALAREVGLSPFHLQRVFSSTVGETPKQLTLRLRLGRAAGMLLSCDDSILDVALSCGFQSHEAFIRAFRRRFRMTPSAYRKRGFANRVGATQATNHKVLVNQVGPCVRLYHINNDEKPRRNEMNYAIVKKQISPQPVLVIRRRVKPSELATTLANVLPPIVLYAQRKGVALAGQPFTRYLDWGPGLWTIEAGMPITAPCESAGESQILADTLPGGLVATTTHAGPYDGLTGAHAAIQQWIESQGLTAAGAPWEVYVTDPADYPDPKDWKTDLFWPLAG